jgi:trehalose 6-phosphate synthase
VALVGALRERGGVWFGWSGRTVGAGKARLRTEKADGITLATIDLSQHDYDGYYNGFSNNCLWPLLHFRIDLIKFERGQLETYWRVNRRFAQSLAKLLRPDDLVWVHDFHLLPLAEELRRQRMRQRIGFFLHTPFPPTEILSTLPVHESLTRALFAYDLIGFQTEDDLARFRDHVVRACGGRSRGEKVTAFGREIRVGAFPIGIDVDQFKRYAFTAPGNKEYARMRKVLRGRDQFIGVDRLDYSKGLLRRMDAFGRYLESHPRAHGKVILLQVAPVAAAASESYRNFRQRSRGGTRGCFASTGRRCIRESRCRAALVICTARAASASSPHAGRMNCGNGVPGGTGRPNPGVLVLSRFAGAAQYLREALLVNPYDGEETAEAMHLAREMNLQERRRRHEALMRRLEAHNVDRWRRDFMSALVDAPAWRKGTRKNP